MPMTSGRVPAASRTPGRPPGANLALWLRADLGLTTNGITLTSPNDLANPAWFPTGSSAVANATTDPVGGTNASSLIEDGSNGFHYILNIFSGWLTGRVTTLSVYAKAGARNWFFLSGNGANDGSFFDVTNGVMGNTTGTILSKSMRPVGGGWFLCSITLVTTAANLWVSLATGNGVSFPSYAGNGTGNTYFYGAAAVQTKVSVWADQSGHGRDAVQASAASQPLYLATGANGAPTIAFDGIDDLMTTVSFTLPQPFGVWMVANVIPQSPAANKDVVWAAGSNSVIWFADTTPRAILYAGNTSVGLGYVPAEGVYADLAGIVDDAVSVIRGDGTPLTPLGSPGTNSGTGAFSIGGLVGSSHQATVELAELIVLTNPTTADVAAVETYLQDRYRLRPLPFVPTMLPGCVCWLRADLGITLNGSNVAAWADQSGNGNNAVQATAGNQPAFSATGYDGLPCVDWGAGAVGRSVTVPSLSLGQSTMIGAIREDAVGGYFLVHNSDTTNGSYIYGIANNAFNLNGAGVDSGYNVVVNWLSDGVRRTVSVNYGGTHATHFSWRNGTPDVDVSTVAGEPGSGVATGPLYLGTSQVNTGAYHGVMAEVIVYNRSLSAQELTLVHTYLKSRYGL